MGGLESVERGARLGNTHEGRVRREIDARAARKLQLGNEATWTALPPLSKSAHVLSVAWRPSPPDGRQLVLQVDDHYFCRSAAVLRARARLTAWGYPTARARTDSHPPSRLWLGRAPPPLGVDITPACEINRSVEERAPSSFSAQGAGRGDTALAAGFSKKSRISMASGRRVAQRTCTRSRGAP